MSPRKFDRFMVDVHIASNPKLSRLNVQERWCHVAGVLSLAALAPVRGRLLIGHERAEAKDIARRAGVSVGVARSTLEKLRTVGVIVPDEEMDCECVHDFDDWNPAPKADNTAAERQQRRRDRVAASRRDGHDVTVARHAPVTPTEVEVEVEGKKEEKNTTSGATNENAHPQAATLGIPSGFLKKIDGGRHR